MQNRGGLCLAENVDLDFLIACRICDRRSYSAANENKTDDERKEILHYERKHEKQQRIR